MTGASAPKSWPSAPKQNGMFKDKQCMPLSKTLRKASYGGANQDIISREQSYAVDVLDHVADESARFLESNPYVDPLHWAEKVGAGGFKYDLTFGKFCLYSIC